MIEGLDRLGKSTLIEGIINKLGYYDVIHYSKPKVLDRYAKDAVVDGEFVKEQAYWSYQRASFQNMFDICSSPARIIFDRAHLGEYVYSPMYRGYSGEYVFDYERVYGVHQRNDIRLILLYEDMEVARHFVDDGQSLGPVEKRADEQNLFFEAFNRSHIKDKREICVTDTALGGFRVKWEILEEALA